MRADEKLMAFLEVEAATSRQNGITAMHEQEKRSTATVTARLKAKAVAEGQVQKTPDAEESHIQLAKTLAFLGERDAAMAEAQRASELRPESKDAFGGPEVTENVTQVYAILGERDRAIQILDGLLRRPSGVTIQKLKIDPIWDSLRSDPRFQKLCEEKQP